MAEKTRITVALPKAQALELKQRVAALDTTVSAYISDSLKLDEHKDLLK